MAGQKVQHSTNEHAIVVFLVHCMSLVTYKQSLKLIHWKLVETMAEQKSRPELLYAESTMLVFSRDGSYYYNDDALFGGN